MPPYESVSCPKACEVRLALGNWCCCTGSSCACVVTCCRAGDGEGVFRPITGFALENEDALVSEVEWRVPP